MVTGNITKELVAEDVGNPKTVTGTRTARYSDSHRLFNTKLKKRPLRGYICVKEGVSNFLLSLAALARILPRLPAGDPCRQIHLITPLRPLRKRLLADLQLQRQRE